jgi:hypothetical protein
MTETMTLPTHVGPVPDTTRNGGKTIRAVLPGHPAGDGLLKSWWVAAEDANGEWVTWECYRLDGDMTGRLGYNAGYYFSGPDRAANRHRALADLTVRAGLMQEVAVHIADEIESRHTRNQYATLDPLPPEDRRMARRLRAWAGR